MVMEYKVAVLLSCYNEEKTISVVFHRLMPRRDGNQRLQTI